MVLVAANEAAGEQLRQNIAFLPGVTGDWSARSMFLSPPTVEGGANPRVAWSWPVPEAHQDLIDAYLAAAGLTAQFEWRNSLPPDWTPTTP